LLLVFLSPGLLVLATLLAVYPWAWAGQNLARGWHAAVADGAFALGAYDAALRADGRALDAQDTPDGWLRLGNHARAAGDARRALKAYQNAAGLTPSYIAAVGHLGDLLRANGDDAGAREAFIGYYVDQQRLADWSWRELRPVPPTTLAVGDGLDFGLVGGMYLAEQQQGALARWTDGRGLLRLDIPRDGPALLRLRLAAPRPGAAVPVQVCVAGQCVPIEVGPNWRTYLLSFDITNGVSPTVEVRSNTYAAPDGRRLGVLVDSAEVVLVR
jgi:tetratricopeptide (TPR) repeat protein